MKKDARKDQARTRVKCPECGKVFWCREDWGYGIGNVDYCSWTCVRKAERREEEKARAADEAANRIMEEAAARTKEPPPYSEDKPPEEMSAEEKRAAAGRMLKAGRSTRETARHLRLSTNTVSAIRTKLGLPKGRGGRIRNSELAEWERKRETVRAMIRAGMATKDICERVSVSKSYVNSIRKKEAGD